MKNLKKVIDKLRKLGMYLSKTEKKTKLTYLSVVRGLGMKF